MCQYHINVCQHDFKKPNVNSGSMPRLPCILDNPFSQLHISWTTHLKNILVCSQTSKIARTSIINILFDTPQEKVASNNDLGSTLHVSGQHSGFSSSFSREGTSPEFLRPGNPFKLIPGQLLRVKWPRPRRTAYVNRACQRVVCHTRVVSYRVLSCRVDTFYLNRALHHLGNH